MITLIQGDITQQRVDVIVNAANSKLAGGGGVDGAIHRMAGPSVMDECRSLGGCPTGGAVATGAGNLKAKKIYHAVGPVWNGGRRREAELLRQCYQTCFEMAVASHYRSIAFPAISTGVYRFPKKTAAEIALQAGMSFGPQLKEIRYVCFSDEDLKIYQQASKKIKTSP